MFMTRLISGIILLAVAISVILLETMYCLVRSSNFISRYVRAV